MQKYKMQKYNVKHVSAQSFHNCLSTLFPPPPGARCPAWHDDDDVDDDYDDDDVDYGDYDDDDTALYDMFCNMLWHVLQDVVGRDVKICHQFPQKPK